MFIICVCVCVRCGVRCDKVKKSPVILCWLRLEVMGYLLYKLIATQSLIHVCYELAVS